MLKVNNKKTISRIALKSLKANKTRNIIAAMAIALTAILFTTLFTTGIGTLETFQKQTIRQSGGDGHDEARLLGGHRIVGRAPRRTCLDEWHAGAERVHAQQHRRVQGGGEVTS